ncbi:glutamine--fructose-6-phosphate aminotransferase [isomerizing] 2-like [Hydractinia symbiolongicarpus]|uniref:glutamine--fructose-6-phosphate aminotransferase [isomerizing] 2-like n=1 Tax=Hydractinia symbiolongicarpus TaxID=13093 RepID=UPI00254B0A00|nr:glutamine--fructose-6-phosphate aminotransferase [isomerizing] 2-like [Hydractinia symbiolongicarpus]
MPMKQAINIVKKHCTRAYNITQFDKNNNKETPTKQTNMEKEIFEQPQSVRRAMLGRVNFENKRVFLNEISKHTDDILRCKRLIVIGAGSSYHVAIGTRQIMEELVELPVFVESASDFLDREVPVFRNDVCIFISQSGETSSVIQACQYCRKRDALTMCVTNNSHSTLSSITDFTLDIHSGKEYGVTSTKTYTGQFLTMVLFAMHLASDKRTKVQRIHEIIKELEFLPEKIEKVLTCSSQLRELSKCMLDQESILLMGRGYQQSSSLEGSLKMKEVTNIHSEGIHSGELKHGPLALIDEQIPIIMIIMRDAVFDKCMNALQQVQARNGRPVLICESDDNEVANMSDQLIKVPKTIDCLAAILTVIPLQMLSLYMALHKNKNVDRPKGLVKTVIDYKAPARTQ